jgi:hypothetical protein
VPAHVEGAARDLFKFRFEDPSSKEGFPLAALKLLLGEMKRWSQKDAVLGIFETASLWSTLESSVTAIVDE